MTFGTSILPPGVWCTLAVELALLLFHVTVTVLVGSKLLKRQATFATAFFALYFVLSLADVGHYFSGLLMQRVWRFGVVKDWIPSQSECNRAIFAIGFFSYLQFSCHLAIAFNRFTAIRMPTAHNQIWSGNYLLAVFGSALFVSAGGASVRFLLNSQPVENEFGGYHCDVRDDSTIDMADINGFVGVGFVLITCIVSFCFELATVTAFRRMNERARREHREDYRLLIYAMILLVANLLMAVQYVCIYLVKTTPNLSTILHPYIIDVLCFSGPASLFFTR